MTIQSLYREAVDWSANSNLLNPNNAGQGRISIYLGKPVRAIARLIYGLVISTIIPAIGIAFHLFKTIDQALLSTSASDPDKAAIRNKSWDHLKCAGKDALVFATTVFNGLMATLIFVHSKSLSNVFLRGFIFLGAAPYVAGSLVVPVSIMISPERAVYKHL